MKSLLAGIVILTLASCSNVQQPVFEEVENFKIDKMGFEQTGLSANLRFNNPNTFPLRLKKIDCDLYIDTVLLGRFSNTAPVRIPASGSFILPLTGQANTMTLFQQSGNALAGKESFVSVKGTARVGRMGFYKNIAVHYADSMLLSLPSINMK